MTSSLGSSLLQANVKTSVSVRCCSNHLPSLLSNQVSIPTFIIIYQTTNYVTAVDSDCFHSSLTTTTRRASSLHLPSITSTSTTRGWTLSRRSRQLCRRMIQARQRRKRRRGRIRKRRRRLMQMRCRT
jgi:hypothetical protein